MLGVFASLENGIRPDSRAFGAEKAEYPDQGVNRTISASAGGLPSSLHTGDVAILGTA
jgi:hypothetical protein